MAAKRVTPCPDGSQKCVSTLDTQKYCAMDPVPYSGSAAEAKAAVLKVIADYPRTSVVEDDGDYVKAIFKTKVIRWKDTVEFEVDSEDNVVHFRSESVPYAGSDLGANRKRMTEVRANLVTVLGG
ncbi:hypothetical protein BH09ACT12_BH09ACT12_09700 [soil metagenome]